MAQTSNGPGGNMLNCNSPLKSLVPSYALQIAPLAAIKLASRSSVWILSMMSF
jgi:hypothetical protein